jgi:hypothetical protein
MIGASSCQAVSAKALQFEKIAGMGVFSMHKIMPPFVTASTQPPDTADRVEAMQVIKKHTNSFQKYIDKLLSDGTVSEEEVSAVQNRVHRILQEEFDMAKEYVPKEDDWLSNVWAGFKTPAQLSRIRNTGLFLALFLRLQMSLHVSYCITGLCGPLISLHRQKQQTNLQILLC